MEKKIKILYILSILSILAFLGMQGYWLYSRYEYSLWEYEDDAIASIEKAIDQYYKERVAAEGLFTNQTRFMSSYNMNHNVDSLGERRRTVTVTTKVFNSRHLLGIDEDRVLTEEEKERLAQIVNDSISAMEEKKATVDASSAPNDGIAWTGMQNFDLEIQSPFSAVGLDSLLKKDNINAEVSLAISDTILWKPITSRHSSILNPRLKYIKPYSELERKVAVIECHIPTAIVVKEMAWTLVLALIISVILIICLIWQIKTIRKLTRLDKMRNMFISTMIHELKRPLSTLKMCVSGIENEKMLADREIKAELMAGTRTALDNLSAYFSKLRDITFNNVEQIPLNITRFNVSKLVDDVISSQALSSFKTVRFENRVDEDMEISADRTHMFNIINNLIENAIKYSDDEVDIIVEASNDEYGMALTVTDTGYGIQESDFDKIFHRFYRGKASHTDIPGMGIGLAYVKLLTEAHGGSVSLRSKLNVGTSFTIIIPQ